MGSAEVSKHKRANNPTLEKDYDALKKEFARALKLLTVARAKAKLTQAQVARRMGTSQSAVARMESGNGLPSTTSLVKYARAVGRKIEIKLSKVG